MKEQWHRRFKEIVGYAKLNTQMNRLFLAVIAVYTITIGCLIFYIADRDMRKYALQSSEDVLTSISSTISNSFETVSTMSKMIIFSDEVIEYLNAENGTDYTKTYRAIKQMYNITNHFAKVKSVHVFRKDGTYLDIADETIQVHTEMLQDAFWKQEIAEKAGGYSIYIDGNGLFELRSKAPVITLLRVIYDPETQKETGVIAVNYEMSYLERMLKKFDLSADQVAIATTEGRFLCGKEEVLQSDTVKTYLQEYASDFHFIKNGHIISSTLVQNTDLRLIKYDRIPSGLYYDRIPWMLVAAVVILSMIGFVAIRFYVKLWVTRPIEKLVMAMEQVKGGWLHRVSLDVHTEEIRNLKDSYNQMLVQINRLIEELVEQEKVAHQAKLDVMLEQLNPHFLYNTLETVGYMALESPREEIYEAVESLGEFYRYFLNRGDDLVPLRTEIAAVKDYMKIQKYRYGEMLDEVYEIEAECRDCLVPKLILQPLVENSIYHGIRPKGENGIIKIRAYLQDGSVVLEVYDDGIGMPEEKVRLLTNGGGLGFGLSKTLQRLSAIYGRERLYEIRSEEGCFCEIRLFVPFQKDTQK